LNHRVDSIQLLSPASITSAVYRFVLPRLYSRPYIRLQ